MHNKPILTCAAFLLVMRKGEFRTPEASCSENLASVLSSAVKAKDFSRQSVHAISRDYVFFLPQVQP